MPILETLVAAAFATLILSIPIALAVIAIMTALSGKDRLPRRHGKCRP